MDPRLFQYYDRELQHLREMGAEFATEFPKIAARLGMRGIDVADPYVERLLEGVAFLAARVQLKIDAEFPRFTQALLETIYPQYLAPTPSMVVVRCSPITNDPALDAGFTVPRGTMMQGTAAGDNETACEFRLAQDVTLWPVQVEAASYFTFAPDLPLTGLSGASRIRGGVRIRLRCAPGRTFAQLPIERLRFYFAGADDVANRLYELATAHVVGAFVTTVKPAGRMVESLGARPVRPVGFADEDAVLPVTLRSFQGYRLLQEYFAFPQRFRFADVTGLRAALSTLDAADVELVLVFGRGDPALENVVDAENFALFCAPAVNLFEKRADRIHVDDSTFEFHVVPDRTRPLDYEVYEVTRVVGHGVGADSEREFLPFYTAYSTDDAGRSRAYFTTRRQVRLLSADQRRKGVRSSYIGTETFIGLVDPSQAPFSGDLRQLSLTVLCTNRDLSLHMPIGLAATDFTLDAAAPVERIRIVSGPSRPAAPIADGAMAWRAVSHLTLNYLSLVDASEHEGAAALRELLELYVPGEDPGARKQIEGIRSVTVTPVVRRLPRASTPRRHGAQASALAFGRGLEIALDVDEMAFAGGSAFVLGAVLNQYFARHVSLNSFTELVLRSQSRGEINRWATEWGVRPTL